LTSSGWVRFAACVPPSMRATPSLPAKQLLGQRHLDRHVRGPVDDERRAGDLAQPAGDVVAFEQALPRLAHAVARQIAPLRDPVLVENRVAEDQAGDRLRELVDRSDVEPGLLHLAVGRQPLRVLGAGLRVDQDQRPHALRRRQRRAQREEAALRHASHDRALDPEMVEQLEAVRRGVPVRERGAVESGLAEPALVPGDHAELGRERLHLRREHLPVHEEAVRENQRRALAAGVVVRDSLSVDLGECHRLPLLLPIRGRESSAGTCMRRPA
jgi:hypothetical protein